MLSAATRWGGGDGERPFLPRAFSVLRAPRSRPPTPSHLELQFLIEDVGPGTNRLCELASDDELLLVGPLGFGFAQPREGRAPLLVGGGVGIAPLAIWQDAAARMPGDPGRCSASATPPTPPGLRCCATHAWRPTTAASATTGSSPSCWPRELDEDPHVEVYACGPPPMLEAVRQLCAQRATPAQLALESGMACGFGACFGCVVPTATASCACASTARCSTPPRSRQPSSPERAIDASAVEFCGIELVWPDHQCLRNIRRDRRAARVRGELIERFPFAAFVSKTVTLAPRQGNPPPRLWELAGGMINSIGLPNKGLEGYLAEDLPKLAALPVPLIVNVMGFSREEVAELVERVRRARGGRALELNVSCPNVETGLVMGADPGEISALLEHVRPLTDKPLIVKLTPNASDVAAVARPRSQRARARCR